MATNTLQDEIQKKQNTIRADLLKDDQKESEEISKVIDLIASEDQYSDLISTKGIFTKEEVIQAAKFALKAKPYDITVRHLKVSDSPIYYKMGKNQKLESRGRFKRKDLDDMANLLIKRAQDLNDELKAEKRRQDSADLEELVTVAGTMEIGEKINEEEASMLAESRQVDDYESSKIIDRIMSDNTHADNLDLYFNGKIIDMEIEENKNLETKKLEVSDRAKEKDAKLSAEEKEKHLKEKADEENKTKLADERARKKYFSIIDSCLSNEIPSLSKYKRILDEKLVSILEDKRNEYYNNSNKTDGEIVKALRPEKERLVAKYNKMLTNYKKLYDAVKNGEMAPEVLKLFLNSTLMNSDCESERVLYRFLMRPKGELEVPTDKEDDSYKETLTNCALSTHIKGEKYIQMQVSGGRTVNPTTFIGVAIKEKMLPTTANPANRTEAVKTSFNVMWSFIHFYGGKRSMADRRLYFSCKPKKEEAMVRIWWDTLKDFKNLENIYFKIGGNTNFDRREKIVFYISNEMKFSEIEPFLQKFSENCKAEGVLEDQDNSVITGKLLQPGIAFAIEPNLKILREKVDNGWLDREELDEMRQLDNPKAKPGVNDYRYSYNMYVNKALILSASIAKKKLNLTRNDKISDHKEQMLPLMKRYFADFMKLAGSDPRTMEVDKNE
ncbi:MAG: hypothetical protein K6F00_09560 [Lachnospiraceae bacterium]|nr:hypothetical protein [Lachnospiraceae bacterium]